MSNIDEPLDPTLAKREYSLRSPKFKLTQKSNSWDTGELTH
jgi:hypothetical protein